MMGLPATQVLILELLRRHGDLYGLQLVTQSEGQLKRGTVYVTLSRMADKGLVVALRDASADEHSGLPRPRYRITSQGLKTLAAQQAWALAMRRAT
jgi:PadR family transcriptional regulator, regulatory protein PadR